VLISERWSGVTATQLTDDHEQQMDYFDILGVDRTFIQSPDELKSKYKRLMTEYHPDRHVSSTEDEQRIKASIATNVTRAYSVIEDPLSRALHLLELHGEAIGESDNSIVDNNLLLEIMEVREEIEHVSSDDELKPILQSCQKQQSEICQELANAFREKRMNDARSETAKLQYWNRIEETILEKMSSVS